MKNTIKLLDTMNDRTDQFSLYEIRKDNYHPEYIKVRFGLGDVEAPYYVTDLRDSTLTISTTGQKLLNYLENFELSKII